MHKIVISKIVVAPIVDISSYPLQNLLSNPSPEERKILRDSSEKELRDWKERERERDESDDRDDRCERCEMRCANRDEMQEETLGR